MNRKQSLTPATVPVAVETDARSRQAWLAAKRQELLTPASALLELSQMLLSDASDCAPPEFLRDQQRVHAAASRLLTMIDEVLDPLNVADVAGELPRRIRHDLRTPLTEIIGLCEFWLEDAVEPFLEGFVPDLQTMLGLSKKLVEDMDGILDFGKVASDPDINLDQLAAGQVDLIRDLVHSLPFCEGHEAPLRRQTGTILVVEDNPINRDLLVRRLTRDGHTVVEAADGRQGLTRARAQEFDVILLDVLMPELNGLQMLEQLKADPRLRHIPVIMVSAFNELDGAVRCLEMGAEDYLAKPFNPVLLRARIDGCLEKKRLRDREGRHSTAKPRRYEDVAVLFADVVGFNPFGVRAQPEEEVNRLQTLIESWEEIALQHGVEKIKTVGDAFMAAAGMRPGGDDPVLACLRCARDMIAACRQLPAGWDLRVGIDVGPVVAGAIGRRQSLFDLWGDTVNTAATLERHGRLGAVMLSATAWQRVASLCRGEACGAVSVKGKGLVERFRFDGFLGD
jgi:CheY-like chemotaxis protein